LEQLPDGASILVVDDTIENLRLLSSILEARGHEVRPVTSGPLALQAAAASPPELVLLDINMPTMDGLQVCRHLKQVEPLRDIPVIFLTALADTADKVRAFEAGGADYITKPFQVEEVLARVGAHLQLRRSRARLQASFERLRALEQMRDDLTNMVVHDLRSPLGALMMTLEFMHSELHGRIGEPGNACVQSALQAATSANRLVNDILDVARMEEGRLPLDLQPTDLVEPCREAMEMLRAWDRTRQLQMAADGPVEVRCDRTLVRRVVENLVGNAIKHTPSSGSILVKVDRNGTTARIEVRDNGRGVPPEARGLIFDRYTSLVARKDSRYHSAGLGLTFCRLVVEAHGGRIGVEGVEPVGSVFWLELPVEPAS